MNISKTFAGIPDVYASSDKAKIVLIPVPYDGTSTWQKGADKGPKAFLEASENMELYDIETDSEVYKEGIYLADAITENSSPEAMVDAVHDITKKYIRKNKFVTVFGGEHSISIGTIRAFDECYNSLTVLHIDAHADLRESYEGTKCNHACAVYEASQTTNLVQVGIRSMDAIEKTVADDDKTFYAHDMVTDDFWMGNVIDQMTDTVFITFDLDAFDPSIMPSTGTPEPGGLLWYETLDFLKKVFEEKNVVGFDIVELCPNEADKSSDFLAAKLYYKMLSYKFSSSEKIDDFSEDLVVESPFNKLSKFKEDGDSESNFIEKYYLHFNAASVVDAAKEYEVQLAKGSKMLVSLAGAMSTAELGKIFAEVIRQDKVHIISSTGANLEEDIMNLVAHSHYKRVPNYRDLTPQDEWNLLEKGLNRVTDTCIPEEEAFRRLQKHIVTIWKDAEAKGERYLPHEYMYKLLLSGVLEEYYEIDIKNSWMYAAAEKNLPIVCPGWEDSTMGNIFASYVLKGELKASTMKSGIEYMTFLADWYTENSTNGIGFFQIGGGIAGDFPICVVPMLYQDMERTNTPFWSYFCQISDSTTSYGSYSGAVPNEKITWGKLDIDTPKFIIESDATIVAPLIFAYLLNM